MCSKVVSGRVTENHPIVQGLTPFEQFESVVQRSSATVLRRRSGLIDETGIPSLIKASVNECIFLISLSVNRQTDVMKFQRHSS